MPPRMRPLRRVLAVLEQVRLYAWVPLKNLDQFGSAISAEAGDADVSHD